MHDQLRLLGSDQALVVRAGSITKAQLVAQIGRQSRPRAGPSPVEQAAPYAWLPSGVEKVQPRGCPGPPLWSPISLSRPPL